MRTISIITTIIVLLCVIFTGPGCNTDSPNSQKREIPHPTEINKEPLKPVDHTIINEQSELWIDSADIELVTSIGVSFGKKEYMIARVTDLDVHNGNVILLDGKSYQIKAFDIETGEFVQQFGRKGKGPGEFMFPMEATVEDNLIIVSDRLLKAEIFKLNNDQYESYDQVPLDFSGYYLCTIGNSLFVEGYNFEKNEHTVHQYDLTTRKKINSFHPPYQSDKLVAKISLSRNKISCNPGSKTVIATSHYLPFVYGYNPDGQIKWTAKLDQYYYRRIIEVANDEGRLSIGKGAHPNGYNDYWGPFTPLGTSAYHIIQLSRVAYEEGRVVYDKSMLLTYLVDTRDGSTRLISRSLPSIKSISNDKLISYSSRRTFPKIEIFEINHEKFKSLYN